MSVKVEWYDRSGTAHGQECDYVEEGETGVFLYQNPGPDQIGYVPYENLEHVIPSEED